MFLVIGNIILVYALSRIFNLKLKRFYEFYYQISCFMKLFKIRRGVAKEVEFLITHGLFFICVLWFFQRMLKLVIFQNFNIFEMRSLYIFFRIFYYLLFNYVLQKNDI